MMNINGLTNIELFDFQQSLIKANDIQLRFMINELRKEIEKRLEQGVESVMPMS